ncbi:MAG: chloride channel protein [Gemmatimonadota bacterium]
MTSPVRRLQHRIQRSETTGPVLLSLTVGLLAGVGAIVLRQLISAVQWVFFVQGARLPRFLGLPGRLGDAHLLLAPAIGMVIVYAVVRRWAREAKGHGVPEVQYAVRTRGGRIRPRVAVVKAIASAISIGSGGSVGREGPIVQIGSALGSTVGQVAGLGPEQVRILVAGGAAGAIGATFNAPIAGVMFALEVILASFAARSFGLVVIASVTATAVSQAFLGRQPAFRLLQTFSLVSEREFLLYLVLGLFIGVIATAYTRSVYWFEEAFERWDRRPSLKAMAGGLAVGALGFFGSAHIFGVGHEGVELALQGNLAVGLMLMLVLLKIAATSITLGAGGSGGVFAPALFIGAMAGGAFGQIANALFPTWTAPAGAYALVAMAALFGAAAHAPITGIIILFEMTDDYQIILPLMFCAVVSYLLASRMSPDSIYSIKLRRLGGLTAARTEVSVLDIVLVADAMALEFETVRPDLSIEELARMARTRRMRSWPVVEDGEKLVGIVTETDLERWIIEAEKMGVEVDQQDLTVAEVMTTSVTTCRAEDTLRDAFRRFSERDVQQIPVVEGEGTDRLVGVLRRHDMLWAYKELSKEHQALLDRVAGGVSAFREESIQVEYQVPSTDRRIAYRRIRELGLPPHLLVVLIRRAERTFVPRGETRIEPGDVLVLLTTRSHEDELRTCIGDWSRSP